MTMYVPYLTLADARLLAWVMEWTKSTIFVLGYNTACTIRRGIWLLARHFRPRGH
jgi:hypothetical protein